MNVFSYKHIPVYGALYHTSSGCLDWSFCCFNQMNTISGLEPSTHSTVLSILLDHYRSDCGSNNESNANGSTDMYADGTMMTP